MRARHNNYKFHLLNRFDCVREHKAAIIILQSKDSIFLLEKVDVDYGHICLKP